MEGGPQSQQSLRDWLKSTNRVQRVGIGIFAAGAIVANLGAVFLLPSGSGHLLPVPLIAGMVLLITGTLVVMGAAPKTAPGKADTEPFVQRPDATQWVGAAFLYGGTLVGFAVAGLSQILGGPWWVMPATMVGIIACWGAGLTLTGSFTPVKGVVDSTKAEGKQKGARRRMAAVAVVGAILFGLAYVPVLSGIFDGPPAPGHTSTTAQSWIPLDAAEVSVTIAGQGPAYIIAGQSQGTSDPIRAPSGAERVILNTTTDRDGVMRVEANDGAGWHELDLRSNGERSWAVNGALGAMDLRITVSSDPTMSGTQAPLHIAFLGSVTCKTTIYTDGTSTKDCSPAVAAA